MTQSSLRLSLDPSAAAPSSRTGFRFLCRLGQGGMAEVHLAAASFADGSQQLVVVKRMHAQHQDDAATVRMFLDEARLALRLDHPNIVRAHRLGMFDGRHGIVMEFLEGQPLQQAMKRAFELEQSLSLETVALLGIAALDALSYAHELRAADQPLGIVHRDISPQNLFVGYDGAVKLLDFGIAKNAMQEGRTRTGLLKGKLSYMAPEQARGDAIDHRADLWSLGVTLWEAVTGRRLFKGPNEAATLHLTLTEQVARPSSCRPDVPAELEAILMRALERQPELRYPTAAAMRADLAEWLEQRPHVAEDLIRDWMHRLFAGELVLQREKVNALLREPAAENADAGVTLVAPGLAFASGTFSGLRATQGSSVTDLLDELTRQRRTTTRLLSVLIAIMSAAALAAVYLVWTRGPEGAPVDTAGAARLVAPNVATLAAPLSAPALAQPTARSASSSVDPSPATPASAAVPSRTRAARARAKEPKAKEAGGDAPKEAPAAPVEMGRLNLDSSPWSTVSVAGRVLGQTPIVGAPLAAGTHSLVLSNPELGLKATYQVTIVAGRTTARRVGLE